MNYSLFHFIILNKFEVEGYYNNGEENVSSAEWRGIQNGLMRFVDDSHSLSLQNSKNEVLELIPYQPAERFQWFCNLLVLSKRLLTFLEVFVVKTDSMAFACFHFIH